MSRWTIVLVAGGMRLKLGASINLLVVAVVDRNLRCLLWEWRGFVMHGSWQAKCLRLFSVS